MAEKAEERQVENKVTMMGAREFKIGEVVAVRGTVMRVTEIKKSGPDILPMPQRQGVPSRLLV